jgi:hypothetical protein
VGTIIAFKVRVGDTEILEKESCPEFECKDFINLDRYRIYLKCQLMERHCNYFSLKSAID